MNLLFALAITLVTPQQELMYFMMAQEQVVSEAHVIVHPDQVLDEDDSLLLRQLQCGCYQLRMQARETLKKEGAHHIKVLIWGMLSKDPEVAPFCRVLFDKLWQLEAEDEEITLPGGIT